ncbi:hypothetical protein [Peribacillus asahii]|uniref:hypothetical protein n=1 Tax=Peribacillus asahii TaxID=228899 RepID=UPI002079CF71|nr:hypothetical protein [Peribacillus asahii]USK85709.1 hypothetical protein LIT35_03315 [Peribacillus asahii]
MIDLLAQRIAALSDYQLYETVKDVEWRIGSHVAGGNPIDEYVDRQRKIIGLIQDELMKRK